MMRIDFWVLTRLIMRAQQVANLSGPLPKGDAGLYLFCREVAEQLERTNPGIAEAAGFDYAVLTLQNIRRPLPVLPILGDIGEGTE